MFANFGPHQAGQTTFFGACLGGKLEVAQRLLSLGAKGEKVNEVIDVFLVGV